MAYCLFNLFWGMNYNRPGLPQQLGIRLRHPERQELLRLNKDLLDSVNRLSAMKLDSPLNADDHYQKARLSFSSLTKRETWLHTHEPVIRSSYFGWVGRIAGFTGYYNPFTAESNIVEDIPLWMRPFVACHELAHQWGYAREMEANMLGFMAAAHSDDPTLQYAAYLEMFLYANRNLSILDSAAAKQIRRQLTEQPVQHLKEWGTYLRQNRSFLEPLFTRWYDLFLKSNQQPQGMGSYGEVTAFLISYRLRYGHY